MKSKIAFFLLASCIAASAVAAKKTSEPTPWTQEPDSFMGVSFDQKLVYSIPECPSGYEIPKSMCRDAPYQGLYTIKGTPSIGLIGGYGLSAMAKTGPVDSFYLTTQTEDFSRLVQVFITKYGQPTKRTSETIKTKGGAEFNNEQLQWLGKKVEITLQKYDGDINTSSASLRTIASKARAIQDGGQKIQDAAGKL
ncbi:hypothetical protein IB254_01875 [Pseudomonas sp. PDM03]|uniref:hypothetical protein n=1 Tax=Pseudomonas sp. PDM03 TaxID=2769266 RepID=UPI001783D5AE|nr:hypothetical protein [Pseudomonas sp. PDM03]MBD9585793.1 hypothetical protein [Pseudomonas sp. PDM03]